MSWLTSRLARQRYGREQSPCPHCDLPLERALAGQRRLVCPHCRGSLAPLRKASNLRRLGAAAVDALVALAIITPWLFVISSAAPQDTRGLVNRLLDALANGLMSNLLACWPALLLVGAYVWLTVGLFGRTVGQQLCSLRVVDHEGLVPSLRRAGLRAVCLIFCNVPMGLGFLWSMIDASGRAVHDHLSSTYLIASP